MNNALNHKPPLLRVASLTALFALCHVAAHAQKVLHSGDIVVYRIGDGSAALSGAATAVFLDEYNTSGTLINTVAMPTITTGANFALTAIGNANTYDGELNVSTNSSTGASYLAMTGYNASVGTNPTASGSTVPRVVGIVGNGAVDTSTSLGTSFTGANSIRAAYTTDGSGIYAVGSNTGLVYTTKGSTSTATVISSTQTVLRDVIVSNGQLYISAGPSTGTSIRIASVGNGTPTTGNQTAIEISGGPSTANTSVAPCAFFFATLSSASTSPDTLFFADNTAGVIDKYSLVNGTYVASGTIAGSSSSPLTGVEGLTGSVSNGTVNLYATTASGVYAATDTSGYNQSTNTTAFQIVSAKPNTALRGIAFLPQDISLDEPSALPLIMEAGLLVMGCGLMFRRCRAH